MWIKEPKEIAASYSCHLNFLWKDNEKPIYIMDNHLAALWCWLNNLSVEEKYILFHIDFHWDGLDMISDYIDKLKTIDRTSLKEFLAVKSDGEIPAVRWDNYIHPLFCLRPNLHEAFLTAHEQLDSGSIFSIENVNVYIVVEEFFSHLNHNLKKSSGKILFNLDLDFFFWHFNEKITLSFSNDFAKALATEIKPYVGENLILTVALSPECCGGWQNSLKICEVFCNYLNINFPVSQITTLLR